MSDKYKYIAALLDRFFDGKTSGEEEKQLYDFFNGNDIPEHLAVYKSLFAYFEHGLKEELKQGEKGSGNNKKFNRRKYGIWCCVAACIVLVILVRPDLTDQPDAFNPYEGSYIIREGVRITDPDVIRPELEATIIKVQVQEELMKILESNLMKSENQALLIEDRLKSQRNDIVNHFPDEYIRNIVLKLLETE